MVLGLKTASRQKLIHVAIVNPLRTLIYFIQDIQKAKPNKNLTLQRKRKSL